MEERYERPGNQSNRMDKYNRNRADTFCRERDMGILMNRSEFLALMFSPLILPFVKKDKNIDKYILGHRHIYSPSWHVIGGPNSTRTHLYSNMTETTWYDKKGNNDGIVPGAVPINRGRV